MSERRNGSASLRAAWLYYNRGLTQQEVANSLGVSRSTVIRLLDEARSNGQVKIWVTPGAGDLTELSLLLEERFELETAIVVPSVGENAELIAADVGAALGQWLSSAIRPSDVVGIGWGRSLHAALATFRPPRIEDATVISLLGSPVRLRDFNPVDVGWAIANQLGATCLTMPAPLVVDCEGTRQILLEKCALDHVFGLAEMMNLAVVSCGEFGANSTSLSRRWVPDSDQAELTAAGAIGDVLCQFIDLCGETVNHQIHGRVMAVPLDTVARAGRRVLASGGWCRVNVIRAAITRLSANVLVTDEGAARALLDIN